MNKQRISDTIVFPVNEFDKNIADIIPSMPASTRWPAYNALRHLNCAWKIKDIDTEMAMFRGITAEEEAATSLFLSLKRHKYQRAEEIRHKDHKYKNAVIPFVGAISKLFAYHIKSLPKMALQIDTRGEKKLLQTVINLPRPITGKPTQAFPEPPLDFIISKPGQKNIYHDFTPQLNSVAHDMKDKDIWDHIQKRANQRNRILYAESQGYPQFSGNIDVVLKGFVKNVFTILKIYLMVDPYKQHQEFVQQCLYSFLKMLKKSPESIQFD